MRKINNIQDISYKTFKEVEPLLKDVEAITSEEMTKVVSIVYNIEEQELMKKPFEFISAHFTLFLSIMGQPTALITKFESDGVKYGFIPNFSEITTGELIDLDTLLADKNFEGIASILYRPITKESKGGKYEVEPYTGYDEKVFENASISFYLGFIDFFYKSFQILNNSLLTSTTQKKKKLKMTL